MYLEQSYRPDAEIHEILKKFLIEKSPVDDNT